MNTLAVPQHYTDLLSTVLAASARRGEPGWRGEQRQAAFARLQESGFPTQRSEEWKYTNLRPLLGAVFTVPRGESAPDVRHLLPRRLEDESEIIFIDGRLAPEHSRYDRIAGLHVTTLDAGLCNGEQARLRARLAPQPGDDGPFVALNRAMSDCGVHIRIERGAVIASRVHLLFLTTGLQPQVMVSPRVLIDIEPQAEVRFVQSHTGHPGAASFTNVVTDIDVGEGAQVLHIKVQTEAPDTFHCSTLRCRQAAHSVVRLFDLSLGGKLARNDVVAGIDGEGAELHLDGLYALKGRQHVDHHTTIDHRVPRGTSRQVYKGILDDQARVVFNGKVLVRPGAKLTDGYQINQNLLLSRGATVNTKPQLEIENDDVKCTHGATIGQLDDAQRFYVQSRGISPADAEAMLARGFVEDVLYRIQDKALQVNLRSLLDGYFVKVG